MLRAINELAQLVDFPSVGSIILCILLGLGQTRVFFGLDSVPGSHLESQADGLNEVEI